MMAMNYTRCDLVSLAEFDARKESSELKAEVRSLRQQIVMLKVR